MAGKTREVRDGKLRCSKCPPGVWKSFDEFGDDERTSLRKKSYCKPCMSEYYQKHKLIKKTRKPRKQGVMEKPEIQDLLSGVLSGDLKHVVLCRAWDSRLEVSK